MAAYGSVGTTAAAAGQTVSPSYPAGVTAGDALILTRALKPDTAAPVTPAGWTLLDDHAGGAGVYATDTGPVRLVRYWREASGSESGTLTCDSTTGTVDVQMAAISRYTRTAGGTWSIAAGGGVDSTTGTDWSVTASPNPGVTSGDLVEAALTWPTDAVRTWTNELVTATGATFTTLTSPLIAATTSLGADMALRAHNYTCTAGTASAAPVYSATVNSATNVAGPASIVRIREVITGPTPVALTAASMTVAGRPVTPVPQPVTVALVPAAAALIGVPVTPLPQPVVVLLAPAGTPLTALPVTPLPQPVTALLTPAAMALSAVAVQPAGGIGRAGRGTIRIPATSVVRLVTGSEVRIL